MDTARLNCGFGVEVRSVDLSDDLDGRSFDQLEQLFDACSLLLFRDQMLTPEAAKRFIARFGPPVQGIGVVSNQEATGRGELQFHSERSFQRDEPLRGLALYAMEVPAVGGATLFVNCAAAYRVLPEDLRSALQKADTVHRFDPRIRLGAEYGDSSVPEGGWHTVHPAIFQHPVTGSPILYVSPWFTSKVVGMDDDASGELLSLVFAHLLNPAFSYRHEWQANDFLLWDNFAVIHARERYDETKSRVLRKYEFGLRDGFSLPQPWHAVTEAT